jgi:hypothetical protein
MKILYKVILSFSVLFSAFFTQASFASDAVWTVAEISGDVEVIRGKMHKINYSNSVIIIGDKLLSGDALRTGKNSRIILIRGSQSIIVSPQSVMKLPEKQNNSRFTRIIQSLGTLLFSVDKKEMQHFEVKTPYLAAVVKGTTFTVNVDDNGTAVHVIEGAVEVSPLKGTPKIIRSGQTAIVSFKTEYNLTIKGYNAPENQAKSNNYTTKIAAIKSIQKLIKPKMAHLYKRSNGKAQLKVTTNGSFFYANLKSENQKEFIKNHNILLQASKLPGSSSAPPVTVPPVAPPVVSHPPVAPPPVAPPPVAPPTTP